MTEEQIDETRKILEKGVVADCLGYLVVKCGMAPANARKMVYDLIDTLPADKMEISELITDINGEAIAHNQAVYESIKGQSEAAEKYVKDAIELHTSYIQEGVEWFDCPAVIDHLDILIKAPVLGTKVEITGYYGCKCHPFDSWKECEAAHRQKFKVDDTVKNRHIGKTGKITRIVGGGFYGVEGMGTEHAALLYKV